MDTRRPQQPLLQRLPGCPPLPFLQHLIIKKPCCLPWSKSMFVSQFDKAEKLLGETPDPLLVYGVEVSIQMYIAELSEPLRELYVVGYSLPTTSEYIYMSTAQKIQHIFSQYVGEAELKDFYEMDIASAGITRGFMAKNCDLYFTMEDKLRRLLKC